MRCGTSSRSIISKLAWWCSTRGMASDRRGSWPGPSRLRVRLKYALPLAQMALAVVLLWLSRRLEATWTGAYTGSDPPYTLLLFLNPPAVLARALWADSVLGLPSDTMFVASIGISWYWIALNIRPWRERRALPLFTRPPLRITADLLLVSLSVCFLALARRISVGHMEWQWRYTILACILAWFLGPIFLFARDLLHYFRRKAGTEDAVAQ